MSDPEMLLEKLRALPPERLGEVEDFIDFLAARDRRRAALDSLLSIVPELQSSGTDPMTEREIEVEIEAVRAARRARSKLAAGS